MDDEDGARCCCCCSVLCIGDESGVAKLLACCVRVPSPSPWLLTVFAWRRSLIVALMRRSRRGKEGEGRGEGRGGRVRGRQTVGRTAARRKCALATPARGLRPKGKGDLRAAKASQQLAVPCAQRGRLPDSCAVRGAVDDCGT